MSNIELLVQMLVAQNSYSLSKVHKKDRDAFEKTMAEIIKSVSTVDSLIEANAAVTKLSPLLAEDSFFQKIYYNSLPARSLAFEIAEDAIQSLRIRFEDGGSRLYEGLLPKTKFKL